MQRPPIMRLLLVGLAILFALVAQTPAAAAPEVDTALLYPALDPGLSWTCQATGTGVVCRASAQFADSFGDTGLPCGGGTIYEAGTGTFDITRIYTAEQTGVSGPGDYLTRSIGHENFKFTESLSPTGAGITAPWKTHDTFTIDFAVPGDWSTTTQTIRGDMGSANASGTGLLFHDVGLTIFPNDPNADVIVHGPHDLLENFDQGVAALCSVLTGP